MTTPLLTTKLYLPPARTQMVPRLRLIERLTTSLQSGHGLTLVAAPAGFGKTTLVSAWVRAGRYPVAWVSLDEEDNDPTSFWAYVVTALTNVPGFKEADAGASALAALRSPQPPPIKTILTDVINVLAAAPQPIILVLDDYHTISNTAIHDGLAFLLAHQPQQLHLVLSTRADPPLPLYRLRARGRLTELRSEDLRFTPEETATFLNTLMGLDLATEDVKALEARTEGWIVGLQLAALCLQGHSDAPAFISAFTGGHHYILEYLTEEVLRRQPEPVQHFLIETSILDRLCGSLCDAVRFDSAKSPSSSESTRQKDASTGTGHSEALLTYLQQRNLFIVPLDDGRRWYRYHHLFADLLGNLRRTRLQPERILELHRQASLWHEQNGTINDAIKHALQAQDFQKAATLIEQAIKMTLFRGSVTTLLRWSEALPEEILLARPRLRVYQGWALSLSGQPDAAERILHDARRALHNLPPLPENVALRGEIAAMLTGIATLREETSKVIQEGQEALTYLPKDDQVSRARVYVALGTAYAYADEMEKAARTLHQARELALKAGNPFLAAASMEMLAGMQIYHEGRLREGVRTLQQIIELGISSDGSPLPFTATAHSLLADVYLERSDLEAAAAYLDKGNELLQQSGIGYGLIHTYCAQARLKQALGDVDGATEVLRMAERALDAWPLWHMVIHLAACQVRFRLALGDVEAASRWAEGDPATLKHEIPENLPGYLREVHQTSLARVYLARGETEKALETLEPFQAQAEAAGRMAHVIQICLIKALASQAKGDTVAALELLEKALSLAEPEGYVRLFLDEGAPLMTLLQQLASRGSAYAGRLLAAFGAPKREGASTAPLHPDTSVLVEALTKRELEVLQLVCEGYSNQEIARKLVITMSTVKKHTGNIYGKLGVANRAQAIVETHRLRLLPKKEVS
jgi:LuxR family maltose regulon positive regulatory protein